VRSRLAAALAAALVVFSSGPAHGQAVRVGTDQLAVGTRIDLTGHWLFKPTYALRGDETPEAAGEVAGYARVPVPQMLSRIQWWLDDSEDFKKWEQDRLRRLGFDTEASDEGWYRLLLDIPRLPRDRRVWIEFDGVAMRCRAFLNGRQLGEHAGMFSRFSFDLTPHLVPGRNTLALWVSMEKIPPTEGNLGEAVTVNLSAAKVVSMSKGMFGPLTPNQDNRAYDLYGIWQPVRLVVRGRARIHDVWFQPSLTGAQVEIEVEAEDRRTVRIRSRLTDAKTGAALSESATPGASVAGRDTVRQIYAGLRPRLWTPAHPNLYRLDVWLETAAGVILDRWSRKVGFRTFEAKGNQFYLNGHRYWLRGANQLPYGKNPWDPALPRKLIRLMHDGNQRFTRTHATPWNEAWLEAADEIGLAVSLEGIRPWALAGRSDQIGHEVMPPPEIVEHWLAENEDVVKRCRNHPSVFLFTVGNEMLLRDKENLRKWRILSDVTRQTRKLAPDRPIVVSSDYVRDRAFYESALRPAGLDDGDVDDLHRYSGWYSASPFVVDSRYEAEARSAGGARPLIGQEMSTGYPDLDTGLPVLRYTRDLLTPQAWVGVHAYPGQDPAIFLGEHARVTKRWAEQMRYQRADRTAGFSLFSAECWYRHSYDPVAVAPYPVYEAVKQAFAPIGLALETAQRRFWSGGSLSTDVFVTNDDEGARDLADLRVSFELEGTKSESAPIALLRYYGTERVAMTIHVPTTTVRRSLALITRLRQGEREVGRTVDQIEVFPQPAAIPILSPLVSLLPEGALQVVAIPGGAGPGVVVLGAGHSSAQLEEAVEAARLGATAIVFSPSSEIVKRFPDDLLDVRAEVGEFADWWPARGTMLADGLHPMDLKWWARRGDWRSFVARSSQRLKPGGRARELIRFIPSHSYIAAEKVPEQYRAVLSEIVVGKGRLWLCGLAVGDSVDIDPAARLFAENLLRAAADPESTRRLLPMPSHEEMMRAAPTTAR